MEFDNVKICFGIGKDDYHGQSIKMSGQSYFAVIVAPENATTTLTWVN